MFIRKENNQLKRYIKIPSKFKGITGNYAGGFYKMSKDIWLLEGFKCLIFPKIDISLQRYGDILEYDDKFEYSIIEITEEELLQTAKIKTKTDREGLLKAGVIIDNIWFNETYLGNFINAVNLTEKANLIEVEWKDDDDVWIILTIDEANSIALRAMQAIKQIYKDN